MRLEVESKRQRIQIDPEQLVEMGPSRTASRVRVRALLAPFLCQDGYVVEQLTDEHAQRERGSLTCARTVERTASRFE